MKKGLRIALILILAAVFVTGMVNIIRTSLEYKKGVSSYEEAEELANISALKTQLPPVWTPAPARTPAPQGTASEEAPPDPEEPDPVVEAMFDADLAALQEVNGDIIGWFFLPGTDISYPLVHRADNTFYLTHNWKRESSSLGAIFVDCECSADLSDFNTKIYGHRMNNGSMFAQIRDYAKQDYWESHPFIYIRIGDRVCKYAVYAGYEAEVGSITYSTEFPDNVTRAEFIACGVDNSVIETGVVPSMSGHIITLITCTGRGYMNRWVVQATLVKKFFPAGDP